MKSIQVDNLGKRYRVYFEKPALIKSILPFLVTQGKVQQFWALRDISFEVGRGECIGVVGPNGSGKSTILSVLAGVTAPTEGSVTIDGNISSLLTLGAGFHFELTGQENIYLNSAILGLSKAQVDAIYDDIVEFADLGKFMNAKISTYSSGMNMRLGFSIAIMVPFDVLLIDEVLAVGDMEFQTKCFRTMRRFYEDEGKTIIFVSHDLTKIEELCSRVIWFEHGRVEAIGDTIDVLKEYREKYREKYEPLTLRKLSHKKVEPIRPARITVDASMKIRKIPPLLFGSNIDWLSEGPYFWDSRKGRLRLEGLREIQPFHFSSFRFPGGHHADFYKWKEAVGENRVEQLNGGRQEKSFPYFGTDEFIQLCKRLEADPILTANVISGTPAEAVEWLDYCRSRGLRVQYMEIGHEPYYDEYHVLGKAINITPEEYAARFLDFAKAIRGSDSDIKLLACGCLDTGVFTRYRYPDWNRVVLEKAGDEIDFISMHNTQAPILNITSDYGTPPVDVSFEALLAAPLYVGDTLDKVSAQIKEMGKSCKMAITEYCTEFTDVPKIVHGKHEIRDRDPDSDNWGRNSTVGAALYEAMLLNLFIRNPGIDMASRVNIQNPDRSALLVVRRGGVVKNPQYYMQKLYNRLAGKLLVRSEVEVDSYNSQAVGIIPAQEHVPFIDQIAVISDDGSVLALFMVNRSLFHAVGVKIAVKDFDFRSAMIMHVHSPEFDSRNSLATDENVWAGEHICERLEITHRKSGRILLTLPKHSLTVLLLYRAEWL